MKSGLVLCMVVLALLAPVLAEMQKPSITSETVVKGNGTVITEMTNPEVNIHDSFVAMTPGGMVYKSQVNGMNVSINTSQAMEIEFQEGMKRMEQTVISPIRDPFEIKRPQGL